jgi:hypothetical protein
MLSGHSNHRMVERRGVGKQTKASHYSTRPIEATPVSETQGFLAAVWLRNSLVNMSGKIHGPANAGCSLRHSLAQCAWVRLFHAARTADEQ